MRVRSSAVPALAGIIALGTLAYYPSLGYPYLQDAVHAVWTNPVVERGDLGEIFASDYWKDTPSTARRLYRPVTVASFALERALTGEPSPFLSHLLNLLLHQLAACALFAYALRIGARAGAALAAALLFTVHPLFLQGVANVVGRADLLALLFTLTALTAASATGDWRGSSPPALRQRTAAWLAAAALFLALGSKEISLAAPLLILAQELIFRRPSHEPGRRFWLERAAALAPCALAVVAFVALRTRAIDAFPGLQAVPREDNIIVLAGVEGGARLATALGMAARYVALLCFPSRLSADYSGTALPVHDSLLGAAPLLGLGFLLGLLGLGLAPFVARRLRPATASASAVQPVAMAAWVFLLPYLIVGNLLVLSAAGFAERLLYVPGAGFCLIAGIALHAFARLARLRAAGPILLGVLLVLAAFHTRSQARMWESAPALFERSLAAAPRSLRFNMAMAHQRRAEGNLEDALRYFERNVELAPQDPGSWSDLGVFLTQQRDYARAEEALRRSLELDPQRGEAHAYLGAVQRRTGRLLDAERSLKKALLLRPDLLAAAEELGDVLFAQRRYREAAYFYRGCVQRGATHLRDKMQRADSLAAAPPRLD